MGRKIVCCPCNRCPNRPTRLLRRFRNRPWYCDQCGRLWVTTPGSRLHPDLPRWWEWSDLTVSDPAIPRPERAVEPHIEHRSAESLRWERQGLLNALGLSYDQLKTKRDLRQGLTGAEAQAWERIANIDWLLAEDTDLPDETK